MKPSWSLLILLVVVALASVFLTRQCFQPPRPTFPTDRLDSVRTVTETLRVEVRVRDTLWRTRVQHITDSIPVVIARVDSLACAPVIGLLTSCGVALDSARSVVEGWKSVALRDSAQVVAERLRADSIFKAWPKPKRLGCGIGPAALVGLDGRISAGAGISCGFRF